MVPKQYTPDYFPHWTEVSVRFNDMDSLSHVNNALFNSYFEEARIQVLQEIPEWIEDLERKRSFVLRKSTIEYLAPILYPDTLLIGSGLLRVDAARVYALQAITVPILIDYVLPLKQWEFGSTYKLNALLAFLLPMCSPTIYYLLILVK